MKNNLLILLLLFCFTSHSQTTKPFIESEFPSEEFLIKKEVRSLNTIEVSIIQVSPKNQGGKREFYCRAWVIVKQGSSITKELSMDMEAVGGCSGFMFPDSQPTKNLIVLSRFGDYDGAIFIVNGKGELKNYMGGKFYISADYKYLFSEYDSDLSGLTILDLTQNKVLFTGTLNQYLEDWYFEKGKYYAIVKDDKRKKYEYKVMHIDFESMKFKESIANSDIDLSKRLTLFNDPQSFTNCNCGNKEKIVK